MTTALATIPTANDLVTFDRPGFEAFFSKLEADQKSIIPDISTPAGRDEIRSRAFALAKLKNDLDKKGADVKAEAQKIVKAVDAERNTVWDRMEALQHEVRKPLTDWENAEKARVERFESLIAEFIGKGQHAELNWQTQPVESMREGADEIAADLARFDWAEFGDRARREGDAARAKIGAAVLRREQHDKDQADLARLRQKEADDAAQAERQRIADEAAEKARLEEQARAQVELDWEQAHAENSRRDHAAAEARADAARWDAIYAEADSENARFDQALRDFLRMRDDADFENANFDHTRASQYESAHEENDRRDAAWRVLVEQAERENEARDSLAWQALVRQAESENDAIDRAWLALVAEAEAENRAIDAAAQARQKEIDRQAAQQKADEDARLAREQDLQHKKIVNNAAAAAIADCIDGDLPDSDGVSGLIIAARAIVAAIAKGEIPNVKINY